MSEIANTAIILLTNLPTCHGHTITVERDSRYRIIAAFTEYVSPYVHRDHNYQTFTTYHMIVLSRSECRGLPSSCDRSLNGLPKRSGPTRGSGQPGL